jgi:transposase-like protein
MIQERLVTVGSFCWNPACADYSQVGRGNIRRFGKTRAGIQRYQCRTCAATFTATKGTIFYNCQTAQETIIEVLALLAERVSLAAIHRTKGIKEETVLAWLRKAAAHVEEIEALLLANYHLSRAQLDALWTYVGHKGEKGGTARRRNAGLSGAGRPWIVTRAYASGAP